MKHARFGLAIILSLVLAFAVPFSNQAQAQVQKLTTPSRVISAVPATAPKPLTTPPTSTALPSNGPHFLSGKVIDVTEDLKGDVYVVGQDVTIDGAIDGDLLVAAGHVIVKGPVAHNIRMAGGIIELQGDVGGNVTAAAAVITQTRQAKIAGSLVVASNSITVFGAVTEQAWLGANTVTLGGNFAESVHVNAHTLTLSNGTSIMGDLVAVVSNGPNVAQNVTITGHQQIDKLATPSAKVANKLKVAGTTSRVSWLVLTTLMSLVGGAILLAIFPAASLKLAHQVHEKPVASLGWGLVYLLLTPIIAVMLIVTILGLPLGIVLLLVYAATLIFGSWLGAYALGSRIYNPGPLPTYAQQLGQFVIGLAILRILELLPVVGGILKVVVLLVSMGGIVLVLKEAMYAGSPLLPETIVPSAALVSQGRKSHSRRSGKAKKNSLK